MDHRRRSLAWARNALLFLCALAASAPAAENVAWVDDYSKAVAQARAESKLLLVVDVSDDFLSGTSDSPQAKMYAALATSDSRVNELLAARFVCTFRAVGRPQCIEFVPPPAAPASPATADGRSPRPSGSKPPSSKTGTILPALIEEFALAYVCLPSERVLHFIPGFVRSEELLRELEWADATNRDRLQAPPAEKDWFVRQRHLAAALPVNLKAFEERFESKWSIDSRTPKVQDRHDLSEVIRAAREIRDEALLARLKSNWPAGADRQVLLTALLAHGGLEPALAHLTLAEFPLPPLADLDRMLFEAASGGHYWRQSPRREKLLAWWNEQAAAGAHRLLVVADHPNYVDFVRAPEALRWPATSPDVKPNLVHFAAQHLSLDELAQLSLDARLDLKMRFQAADGPPRYLIYDGRGFRIAELSAREGTTKRLAEALAAVVTSGDLAASARARGGTIDERN
jgi:hypothetical protein